MPARSTRSPAVIVRAGLVVLAFGGAAGCNERRAAPPLGERRAVSSAAHPLPARREAIEPDRAPSRPAAPREPGTKPEPSVSASPVASASAASDLSGLVVDELVDVAPAGPASAYAQGIVLIDKSDELHVARRGALPRGPNPAPTPVSPLDVRRERLAPYAKGPAISGPYAYWVSRGRLVRRRLAGGDLEVLATDARTGTRVAAGSAEGGPSFVVYVVAPGESGIARAKLWVDGGKPRELTPDGSGASSVAVARQTRGWLVLSLDGRSGMTPLHARRVVAKGRDVTLGPDVVVWVGSGAQSTTEVMSAARGDDVWGLVAIERDVTHFGLAQVHVGREPRMDAEVRFVPFDNGLNTSPVAAATLCGQSMVLYARPSGALPGAPQELVLAELSSAGLSGGSVLVRSRAFADVSLAALEGGALLSYTADHRTWAATIRCRR